MPLSNNLIIHSVPYHEEHTLQSYRLLKQLSITLNDVVWIVLIIRVLILLMLGTDRIGIFGTGPDLSKKSGRPGRNRALVKWLGINARLARELAN